ncbi:MULTISPECIES: Ig-like domain-containing protein, partial [unclassified Imperialibacter]
MRRHSLATSAFALILFICTSQAMAQLPKTEGSPLPNTSSFFIPDYKDGFATRGDASALSERCYLITQDQNNRFGRLWWNTKLDLTQPFRLDFIIFAGDKDGSGADGFGFVLQTDPRGFEATGRAGGGLGFGDYQFANKIIPSVAIEFDTWRNTECPGTAGDDPAHDHTAVAYNGNICDPQTNELSTNKTPRIHPTFDNIEDNSCYDYVILWQPNADGTQTIQMYVEEELRISHTANMITTVFGGVTNVNYGFTGSTGGARNEQTVCLSGGQQPPLTAEDNFTTPQNTSKLLPVRANDIVLNPDLDSLWTFTILTPAANGSSYIDGATLDIMYTPNVGFAGLDSIQYQICDVPVGRCYSLCSPEWAYIDVQCVPYNFMLDKLTDNELCNDALPDNGSARAYISSATVTSTSVNIWEEKFNDLSTNATVDNGTTSWSKSGNASGYAKVVNSSGNKRFEVNDADQIITWTSGAITTTGYSNVKIQASISEVGTLEGNDNVKAFYQVGTNARVEFFNHSDDISGGSTSASVTIPNGSLGSTVKVIFEFINNSSSEYYSIDDVLVTGDSPPTTTYITAGYTFRWYDGAPGTTNAADLVYTGATYNTMAEGTYTVQATSTYGCDATPLTVTIDKVTDAPVVVINQVQEVTNCASPNGVLEAYVNVNGVPTTAGYTFLWYVGVDFTSSFATGPTATNLKAQNYSVRVINNTSGCEAVEEETVTSTLTAPTVQATVTANVTSCTAPNSGAVSASSGGVTAGFTFKWYKGSSIKAIADYTGATVSNLVSGFYTVQAVNSSGCVSEGVTVEITNTSGGPVLETEFTENTSCRVDGNGTITTTSGGATTGFTFEYFIGQNTTNSVPAYKITGNDGNIASLLKGGIYTVKVTETATGCFSTEEVTISDIPSTLTIDPSQIDLNSNKGCGPTADGSIDASAAVSGGSGSSFDSNGNPIAISSSSNGGFDQPDIFGSTPFAQSFVGGAIKTYNQSNVPGWQTTSPDGRIEIWSSGALGVPAYQGTQFAEINANNDATLYFDVVTVPGVTMNWSFAHRGRAGTDCIALLINAPGAPDNQINQFCTGNTAWSLYSGTYVVPAGQYVTRFFYKAVSTAGGNKSVGNFLDAITFEAAANTFELFLGNDTNGVPISSNETGVFSGLDEGTYSIKFLDNLTGCFVSATDLVVSLDQDVPNTVVTKVDNTGCTVGDGEILVVSESQFTPDGEPAAGYNMELWQGGVKIDEEIGVMWQNATLKARHTFTGLLSGTYTVKSTNPAKTCTFEQDVTLDDLSVDPQFVVTGTTNEPNHGCDTPDGRLTVQVDDGAGNFDDPSEYTFEWYFGSVVSAPDLLVNGVDPGNGSTPAINSNTVTGLAAGFYTVVATKTSAGSTGCESPQYTLEVSDEKTIPDITIVEDQPDISCGGAGTAQLSASVTENGTPGVTVGYTFEWFTGATAGTAGTGFATGTQTAANLSAGEYTVLVTNTATGCVNDLTYEINSNPVKPATTLNVKNPNTSCLVANYNGGATVNVSFNGTPVASPSSAGYTFVWHVGSGTGGAVVTNGNNGAVGGSVTGATTETIGGLNGGQYTVVATNPTTGCEADPFVVTIVNSPVLPNIVITKLSDQTNCDVPNNGSLSADVTVSGTPQLGVGYTFQWYAGGSVSGAVLTTNRQIDNLAAGTYTVRVTNQSTGCVQVLTSSVSQVLADIDGSGTKADSEDCSGNGSITITSASITTSGAPVVANSEAAILASYNLTLQDASNADITDSDTDGSATFGGLMPGTYYVVITHKSSSCDSETLQFDIADNAVSPTLSITEDQPSSICPGGTGGDGEATVTVTNAGGSTDYTYKWHTGTDTSTPIDPVLNTSAATATLTGVAAGFYTVLVTDNASLGDGCFATETVEITAATPTIEVVATTVNANNCPTPNNGSYTITSVTEDAGSGATVVAAVADYTYEFFNNAGTSIQGPNTTASISNLAVGNYSVVVKRTSSQCSSASIPFSITDVSVAPIVSLTAVDNTSCNGGATANGSLTATVTNNTVPAVNFNYTFTWYVSTPANFGNTVAATPLTNGTNYNGATVAIGDNGGFTGNVLSALPANIAGQVYWVRVTDTTDPSSNCRVDANRTIADNPATIVVTASTATPSNQCTPSNGSIELTAITVNGTPTNTAAGFQGLTGYTYRVLRSDATTLEKVFDVAANGGTNTFPTATALAPGTYFIEVTNDLGCVSALKQFSITDASVAPVLAASEAAPSSVCAGGTGANGSATVNVTNSGGSTDYTYQWYTGTSAVPANIIAAGTNASAVTATLTGVAAGQYTVQVTDTNGAGLGCSQVATTTVTLAKPTIAVTSTTVNASNCPTPNNGTYTINTVTENGSAVGGVTLTDYTYEFFNNAGTSIQGPNTTASISNLAVGNYSVVVKRTSSQCSSASIPF